MSRDSQTQAWCRFWNCTDTIIDTESSDNPQRNALEAIEALQQMKLPIAAIEELVNLVHAAHDIGKSA